MATQPTANSKPGTGKTVKQLYLRNLGLFIHPFSAILNRMTTLEKLAVLVESIPADKQTAFQAELGLVVQNYLNEDDFVLSPEQEKEDKRRHADPNPKYATQVEVNHIWGKPLPS